MGEPLHCLVILCLENLLPKTQISSESHPLLYDVTKQLVSNQRQLVSDSKFCQRSFSATLWDPSLTLMAGKKAHTHSPFPNNKNQNQTNKKQPNNQPNKKKYNKPRGPLNQNLNQKLIPKPKTNSPLPGNLRCWKTELAVAFGTYLAHLAPGSSADDSTKELGFIIPKPFSLIPS